MAEPKYQQIADDLRRKIESGELPEGGQMTLPTEIELMGLYDASRNTVRDAIRLLTSRGLVETRPGQGTFVVEKINPFVTTLTGDPAAGVETSFYIAEVEAERRIPATTKPRVEVHEAVPPVAEALGIKIGDPVVSRHQERFIDSTPFSLQTSFYPMGLVDAGATKLIQATDITGGAVAYLASTCGIHQVGYRDSIEVRPPDDHETSFFRIPADGRTPVLEVSRVAFDQHGGRMRLTITVYPVDRNTLRVNVGQVPPHDATAR